MLPAELKVGLNRNASDDAQLSDVETVALRAVDSASSESRATRHVEIWEFDPAWWRIDWKDDLGNSLDIVTYERRLKSRPAPRRKALARPIVDSLSVLAVWVRRTVLCQLFTN